MLGSDGKTYSNACNALRAGITDYISLIDNANICQPGNVYMGGCRNVNDLPMLIIDDSAFFEIDKL